MNHSLFSRAFIAPFVIALMSVTAVPAYAATPDDTNQNIRQWFSRSASSQTQKAIAELPSESVTQIPVPILFGVSLASIIPNFGDPRDGGARSHEGEDIMAPRGTYVVSPTDAVVTKVGTGASEGNVVYTANPGNETFIYMHLDSFAQDLKVGDVLRPGDLIGYVGNTGNAIAAAPHLHFEIRRNRTATDPYPRLSRTFTAEERMAAVEKALANAANPSAEAATLVANFRSTFVSARAGGATLPSLIASALGTGASSTGTASNGSYARSLTLGSRGEDVTQLQEFLISNSKGTTGHALAAAGATGYFGALTQAALAEYQASVAINPASGYFGPITRAYIAMRV